MRLLLIVLLVGACATAPPKRAREPVDAARGHDQLGMKADRRPATMNPTNPSFLGSSSDARLWPVDRVADRSAELGARTDDPKPMPTPLDALGTDLADAFSGYNVLYYAGAVAATGAMALSGADHAVHVRFNQLENGSWNNAANIAGYVVPAVTAPTIWIVGLASRNRRLAGAGSAAIQAVVVTMATTGALKLAVGRPYPVHDGVLDQPDHALELSPFQRLGSWPSGHTAATISIAAALTAYAPGQYWIPAIGYPLAFGIGVGMIDRDSHWASDFVAGALIGHVIGYSIGRNFRKRLRGERIAADAFEVVPLTGAAGVAVVGSW
jgi:membrane-associated phospholipid phosphatase